MRRNALFRLIVLLGNVSTHISWFRPNYGAIPLAAVEMSVFEGTLWASECPQIRLRKLIRDHRARIHQIVARVAPSNRKEIRGDGVVLSCLNDHNNAQSKEQ